MLDVVDGEVDDMFVVETALDQPLEAVTEANDLETLLDGLDGHRANDAVDPRGRSTANDQPKPAGFRIKHVHPSKSVLLG